MKFFLMFIVLIASSCSFVDRYISPEQQCALIKSGSSSAAKFGLDQIKLPSNLGDAINKIEKEILPKLEEKELMSRSEWDSILVFIDKNFDNSIKMAIQQGIYFMLKYVPLDKDPRNIGERFAYYAKCMFQGILECLINLASKKDAEKGILRFEVKDFSIKNNFDRIYNDISK